MCRSPHRYAICGHERTSLLSLNGTPLALLPVEVSSMNFQSSLPIPAFALALSSIAFAQSPPPAPQPSPAAPAVSSQLPLVTQSSRIRAFSAGPGGEVRSLYLRNGRVVDVTPAIAGQLGPAVRKGAKITVIGTESEINGQFLVEAASIRLNDQTFAANLPAMAPAPPPSAGYPAQPGSTAPGPGMIAEGAPPPPPGAPQAPPTPGPRRRSRPPAPCGVSVDAPPAPPDQGGPPPPPPDGMAPPPPPDGMAPPPPPSQR